LPDFFDFSDLGHNISPLPPARTPAASAAPKKGGKTAA
jgi:hypothetical protein